jgi:hypothetical protein
MSEPRTMLESRTVRLLIAALVCMGAVALGLHYKSPEVIAWATGSATAVIAAAIGARKRATGPLTLNNPLKKLTRKKHVSPPS